MLLEGMELDCSLESFNTDKIHKNVFWQNYLSSWLEMGLNHFKLFSYDTYQVSQKKCFYYLTSFILSVFLANLTETTRLSNHYSETSADSCSNLEKELVYCLSVVKQCWFLNNKKTQMQHLYSSWRGRDAITAMNFRNLCISLIPNIIFGWQEQNQRTILSC